MADTLTLDDSSGPDEVTPTTLSLDSTDSAAPQVDPKVAEVRAAKAVKAVPQLQMPVDQVYQEIANGREQQLREKAAAEIDLRKQQAISGSISEVAKKKGGPLTPEEAQHVTDTVNSLISPTDTYSVFEEYYSKDYLRHIKETGDIDPHGMIWTARTQLPGPVAKTDEVLWQSLAKTELINKETEDARKTYEAQGWLPWVADQAKGLIPLRNQFRLLGIEGTDSSPFTIDLLKSALDKQAVEMLQLNFPEFKVAYLQKKEELKDDPSLWLEFNHSLKGFSSSEIILGNAFDVIDKVTAGQIAGWAAKTGYRVTKGVQLYKDYNKLAKELIKASEVEDTTGMVAKEALGDVEGAAVERVGQTLTKGAKPTNPAQEALVQLPSALISDGVEIIQAPGRLGREFATRLANRTTQFASEVMDVIKDLTRVQKIPEALASRIALNTIKEDVKELFKGVQNSVLDVLDPVHNNFSNTWSFDVLIGQPTAQLFRSKEQAMLFAKDHGLLGAIAENKNAGGGWYLKVNKPLNETTDVIRDTFLQTVNQSKDPEGLWKLFKSAVSHVGGADESLTLQHRINRKLATYGASIISKLAKEEGKSIQQLAKGYVNRDPLYSPDITTNRMRLGMQARKERWDQWERVVKYAREMLNPEDGVPGYFAKSPGELDNIYMDVVGRVPDALETHAYFAYKRIVEMDRMLRNVTLYGKKSRQGIEQHQVHTLTDAGEKYNSGFFEAKVVKDWPGGKNSMMIIGDKLGDETFIRLDGLVNQVQLKTVKDGVREGTKVVLEVDTHLRPLKQFGDKSHMQMPRYIVVDVGRLETKPLSWEQVPRRAGGHFEYDYDYYLKQADVFSERIGSRLINTLVGEKTVMPIAIREMGKDWEKHLNVVRGLLRDKEEAAARVYSEAHLHVDFDKIHGWFKWTSKDGKKIAPQLSLHEPIRLVGRDQTIAGTDNTLVRRLESDGAQFIDGTKGGSWAREMQLEFTKERDAYNLLSVADKGTRYNPLYAFEPAKMVDPMPSLHRAIAKMSKSIFLDDYKTFAVEHWLGNAANYLKVQGDVIGSIRSMPYHYFHHGEYLDGTPRATRYALENERKKILQLLGQTSEVDKFLHTAVNHIVDASYRTFGPGKVTAITDWTLSKVTDPTDFVRGAVFHLNLGLFNIAQTMVQANTFANILAFAGYQHASAGTYAAFMTQLSRLNKSPAVLKRLDEFLSSHNFLPGAKKWKSGEFIESLAEGEKTGFFNVAGEHTLNSRATSSKIISSAVDKFLDAGAVFFREGERSVRYGAWHTAYREFRTNNPLGRITDKDRAFILNRADELAVNMSRASNSILHTGLASIPAQFYTYQLRVMEQFLGERFTGKEKARAFFTYGALYGVPSAFAVTGFPFGDYMRRAALEEGYVPGEQLAPTLFHEGVLAMTLALITGKGNMKEGNFYNVQERYGVQGMEFIREALRSDQQMIKVVTGAAGSTLPNVFSALDPFWKWATSFTDPADKQYPLLDSDVLGVLKESAGARGATRMINAINTGNVYSKKGSLLEEGVSVPNAIWQYVSGLSSSKVSDTQLRSWSKKEQTSYDKETENWYFREMQAGLEVGEKDPTRAEMHFQRARAVLDTRNYPEDMRAKAFSTAISGKEALADRVVKSFNLNNVPKGQEAVRQDAYIKELQRKK